MNTAKKAVFCITLTVIGLGGLYLKIPHSGWVLCAGVMLALFSDWDDKNRL